ncbi:MAG TPA: hypothetical protein VGG62_03365 [Terracidiphilus sp.]|jgi:predicted RNA binding protein YcfA (HicA-like mRNA interferase family)
MKLPRDLSGEQLIALLCKHWDYVKVHQVGSHVILQTQELRLTVSPFQRTNP